MKKIYKINRLNPNISYVILVISLIITVLVSAILYYQIQTILKDRLRERIISIVRTASTQFESEELSLINEKNDYTTEKYKNIIFRLNKIRSNNPDISFIYILRKTENPNIVTFVADADSLDPALKVDLNNDGLLNEEDELKFPGDEYDISDNDALRNLGFSIPTADAELTADQWGNFLSGYAPIENKNGQSIESIGIDVEVSDYSNLVNLAFIPFISFVIFLVILLTIVTLLLVRIWKNRVKVVQDLDRQKDELLGLVSHQLATPVSAIKWNTEMMLDGDLGEFNIEQKKVLLSFQDITKELSDLISMILDVSRIQLGRIRVDKQELDLGTFFKEILDIIQPKVQEKEVKFVVDIPKNFPAAMLDKRYTHMTIENLLTNAVKYTPTKGQVSLKVSIKKNILHCEVKDTGVGIPKAEQAKIFGKLFRASNVKNSIDGNGFGLFVAKGAIEAQGGKIWFTSEEGKGSTFFIDLPLVEK